MRSIIPALFLLLSGCGSGLPQVDTIQKQMADEQRAVGDPIADSIGMVLVPIPSGKFRMGAVVDTRPFEQRVEEALSNPDVQERMDAGEFAEEDLRNHLRRQVEQDQRRWNGPDLPQHPVEITRPYYTSCTEVTQKQYEAVMGEAPWADQPLVVTGANYAASYVTWEKAMEFCQNLSEKENAVYRLPTEAEWEYACRAGTTTPWSFGKDAGKLGEHAWYHENAYKADEQYAHRVARKEPNSWALYDMYGNVCEWCSDWLGPYASEQQTDPTGAERGPARVWRGGSFSEAAENLRSSARTSFGRPNYRPEFSAGFRVVREISAE